MEGTVIDEIKARRLFGLVPIENRILNQYSAQMIQRDLADTLTDAARAYPVVTITGPRQSGKTTLCRHLFSDHPYVSLEPLDTRAFAKEDPRGFLRQHADGAIIDEVQHVPPLLSYLQDEVDKVSRPGRFILTGSQHFALNAAISQSLAGRTAVLHLLPLALNELRRFKNSPTSLWATVWSGAYPRIFDREIPPGRWFADYVGTYVQRDVRQVLQVADLDLFTRFLRLTAARTAQTINFSRLAGDVGITQPTAQSWLSVLESSWLCTRLRPWFRNLGKRVTKAPKLHFLDTGLVCYLLGIRTPEQLEQHPLRGAIFESWVVSEIYKHRVHLGFAPDLFHLRETAGLEIDLVVDTGGELLLTEIKSGATVASDFFDGLEAATARLSKYGTIARCRLVYGGDTAQKRSAAQVVPWYEVASTPWAP